MKKIIAIGASNSKKSINKTLAIYAANQVKGATVTVLDLNDYPLPIYSVDLESESGIPANAKKFDQQLQETDGIVISMAEHNGSYTAAFKNLFDWLSRINQKVWKDKPILLLSTSPGSKGGASVLATARTSFPFLGGNIISDFSLPSFQKNFADQDITDEKLKASLNQKIQLFEESLNIK